MKKLRLREVAQLTDFWNADLSVNLSYFEFNTLRVLCFFCTLRVWGNAASGGSIGAVFPAACARCVSASHFGNSYNTSKLFHFYCICYSDQ